MLFRGLIALSQVVPPCTTAPRSHPCSLRMNPSRLPFIPFLKDIKFHVDHGEFRLQHGMLRDEHERRCVCNGKFHVNRGTLYVEDECMHVCNENFRVYHETIHVGDRMSYVLHEISCLVASTDTRTVLVFVEVTIGVVFQAFK